MRHLTVEAKQAIVVKALNLNTQGLKELAEQHNIGYSSLLKWLRQYREGTKSYPTSKKAGNPIGLEQRLEHVMATSSLNEEAAGAYCREHGFYSHQLQTWREEIMLEIRNKPQEKDAEIKVLRAENKLLKQELMRKDKALAETAALLILKKKANLLWGEPEDA